MVGAIASCNGKVEKECVMNDGDNHCLNNNERYWRVMLDYELILISSID